MAALKTIKNTSFEYKEEKFMKSFLKGKIPEFLLLRLCTIINKTVK